MRSGLARRYFVTGKVQGVGYRYFVQRAARELGLKGWVRNLSDGRVELLAMGARTKLDRLDGELRIGPPRAEVRHVTVEEAAPEPDSSGFQIVSSR